MQPGAACPAPQQSAMGSDERRCLWERLGMNYGVFIHTNHKQYVGALVSAYSMRRHSKHADELRIELIHTKDHSFLEAREGQQFLRGGRMATWRMEDLQ